MNTYTIQTEQSFMVTYQVKANDPEEAWNTLTLGGIEEAECTDQSPGEIVGEYEDAWIEVEA